MLGDSLPTLTPEQQRLYTDRCAGTAAGGSSAETASAAWDAQLAALLVSLIPAESAGTREGVRHVHLEDQQTQANRGDALKVLQQRGCDVLQARCVRL